MRKIEKLLIRHIPLSVNGSSGILVPTYLVEIAVLQTKVNQLIEGYNELTGVSTPPLKGKPNIIEKGREKKK